MHELAHLILGHDDVMYESLDKESAPDSNQRQEAEANQWAGNQLVPPDAYRQLLTDGPLTGKTIRAFAQRINRHPGIVVGRLQNDGHLRYNQQRKSLVTIPAAQLRTD